MNIEEERHTERLVRRSTYRSVFVFATILVLSITVLYILLGNIEIYGDLSLVNYKGPINSSALFYSNPFLGNNTYHAPDCACSVKNLNNTGNQCSFLLDYSVLIHGIDIPNTLKSIPCLLFDHWLNHSAPIYSIILTVWNQEKAIERVLNGLLSYTNESWELIVVFDQCRDNSIIIVEKIIKNAIRLCHGYRDLCINPSLTHIRLINHPAAVFETSANNIALRATHPFTQYFVIVQDDQIMTHHGWNSLLSAPVRLWRDIFSVSGRCAHSLWSSSAFVGRCHSDIDNPLLLNLEERCSFHIRDTNNRGPLLLHAARTRFLGYFDEFNLYLGEDEHDLNFRAYIHRRWLAGFMPLDFEAPLVLGGSRKLIKPQSTAREVIREKMRRHNYQSQKSALKIFMSAAWKNPKPSQSTNIYVTPNITLNLYAYLNESNNLRDFTSSHDEKRPLPKQLKCTKWHLS